MVFEKNAKVGDYVALENIGVIAKVVSIEGETLKLMDKQGNRYDKQQMTDEEAENLDRWFEEDLRRNAFSK